MIFYISLVNEGTNKAMASFKYMLCFFSICFLLCACNEENAQASQEDAVEECSNSKIRADLAGNVLEFGRDEVEVWIENPDKTDEVYLYIEVSKDCSIKLVESTYKIGINGYKFFERPLRASLSLPSDNLIKHEFFEAEKILNEFQDKLIKRDDGVISIWYKNEKNEEHGYYIIDQTRGFEINANPILFICEKWNGCVTQYIHPAGFLIGYRVGGYYKKQNVIDLVEAVHKKLELHFIQNNMVSTGE